MDWFISESCEEKTKEMSQRIRDCVDVEKVVTGLVLGTKVELDGTVGSKLV